MLKWSDAEKQENLSDRPNQEEDPSAVRLTGLIVDDEVDAAEVLGELLRMDGHEVTVVHDPHSAIKAVSVNVPDFALIDIGLPGMSGYTLCGKLIETAAPKRPYLIALTGYGSDEDRIKSTVAGFSHHLVKPVDFAELAAVLQRASSVQK